MVRCVGLLNSNPGRGEQAGRPCCEADRKRWLVMGTRGLLVLLCRSWVCPCP